MVVAQVNRAEDSKFTDDQHPHEPELPMEDRLCVILHFARRGRSGVCVRACVPACERSHRDEKTRSYLCTADNNSSVQSCIRCIYAASLLHCI